MRRACHHGVRVPGLQHHRREEQGTTQQATHYPGIGALAPRHVEPGVALGPVVGHGVDDGDGVEGEAGAPRGSGDRVGLADQDRPRETRIGELARRREHPRLGTLG